MVTLIDPDTALTLVLEHAVTATPTAIPAENALRLALAQDIASDSDYPPFDRAMMDGYAVCAADAGTVVSVTGEVAAGGTAAIAVSPGSTVEIMTGAPCPIGTEAVVAKEDVARDGGHVTLPAVVKRGQNVTRRGAECAQGAAVLHTGDTISPLALAAIVTFGIEHVLAYPNPALAVISTGDELVPSNRMPGPSQIRNSNAPMLAAMAQSLGVAPSLMLHANDTMADLRGALMESADADFIVLTGAVSAGKYDSVPDALREFGAKPVFHKVLQRPGKPIFFATRGRQLLFGLPGNPLSCHLGFHRYVAPAIRRFRNQEPVPPGATGILAEPFTMKGPRSVFQLARAENRGRSWHITPLIGKGSADMYTPSVANVLLRFNPGAGHVGAGAPVEFEWLLGTHR